MDYRVKHTEMNTDNPDCPQEIKDKLHHLESHPDRYDWEQVGDLYATYEEAMAFMKQYAEDYSKAEAEKLRKSGVMRGSLGFAGRFDEIDTSEGKLWKVMIAKNVSLSTKGTK
jgi:hypothetical protein